MPLSRHSSSKYKSTITFDQIMNNITETTILTRKIKGAFKIKDVTVKMYPNDPDDMLFELECLQFRVDLKRVATRFKSTKTIGKVQGNSLQVCGLNLKHPCFSHEQCYMACSCFGKPTDLFVYAPVGKTRNIVDPTALQ